MYEPDSRHASNPALIWPALFAASASEMAVHFAKQFTSLAIGLGGKRRHRRNGRRRTGSRWLVYAARFPGKVRKLVLAAAPVDTKAAPSVLSTLANGTAMEVFQEIVRLGDGLVVGSRVLKLWGPGAVETEEIRQLLESEESHGSSAFARLEAAFRDWYAWTVDLPGRYFLETVEKLYKRNEIAAGTFEALGSRINLKQIEAPLFLLAAGHDELVTPPQLFAVERLVGTPPHHIRRLSADCRHLGLFVGKRVLHEIWPDIVDWLIKPATIARNRPAGEIQPAA